MRLAPMLTVINRIVNLAPNDPFSLSLLERFPPDEALPRDHVAPDQPAHKFMVFFR